jgi:hypothetical protein
MQTFNDLSTFLFRTKKAFRLATAALGLIALCLCALMVGEGTARAAVSNSVTIRETSGSTQTNRPFSISRFFAQGEIAGFAQARVNGTAVTTQTDVKTRWADGSLKHAMVSFVVPSLPGSGSVTVDFINQATGNNTGFMDKTAMLAANWGGQIEVTSSTTLTANARQILTDWAGDSRVTYWLQGPICTQVILEDRSTALKYDLGWDSYKPLHPIFVVTFYPAAPNSVKVEMILENMWTTKIEDQTYSLALRTGNPLGTTGYAKGSFTHYAQTRWRKVLWSGTPLGSANVDYNFAYLTYSKAIPNYNPAMTPPSSTVSGMISAFNATDQGDINGNAQWLKYMPQTGGRDDIGLFPAWYADYFYTFDPGLNTVMLGNAAVSGYVPLHLRESDSTLMYDSGRTVSAFGRSASLDARPTMWGPGGTGVAAVGTKSNAHGWTMDVAHEGEYAYIPYLITGDWYFLEELYQWAANAVAVSDPGNINWGRNGSWGIISYAAQTRGIAWGLRELTHAAVMAPDGTPEKAYYIQKLNNNIAVREGNAALTNGSFYDPSPNSVWTWGRTKFSRGLNPSPLGLPNPPDEYASKDDMAASVEYPDSPMMYGYLMLVYGHMKELGFPIDAVQQHLAKYFINAAANPSYNPWLMGMYRVPGTQLSDHQYFQTWSALKQGYVATAQALTAWPNNGSDDSNISHGYPHIAKAAASFTVGLTDGGYTGQAAWNWLNANVGYQSSVPSNPRWAIIPRTAASAPTCDLNNDGRVDAADVQLSINGALGLTSLPNGDLNSDGRVNVVDTQRVINASLSGTCRIGP